MSTYSECNCSRMLKHCEQEFSALYGSRRFVTVNKRPPVVHVPTQMYQMYQMYQAHSRITRFLSIHFNIIEQCCHHTDLTSFQSPSLEIFRGNRSGNEQ